MLGGGRDVAAGVIGGVAGIVAEPIRGAKSGGASGFVKGAAKGLLGAVVKPVVGVTDAAVSVLDGISHQVDNLFPLRPLEPRRALPFDPLLGGSVLRTYSALQAAAQLALEAGALDGPRGPASPGGVRAAAAKGTRALRETVIGLFAPERSAGAVFLDCLAVGERLLVASDTALYAAHSGDVGAAAARLLEGGAPRHAALPRGVEQLPWDEVEAIRDDGRALAIEAGGRRVRVPGDGAQVRRAAEALSAIMASEAVRRGRGKRRGGDEGAAEGAEGADAGPAAGGAGARRRRPNGSEAGGGWQLAGP